MSEADLLLDAADEIEAFLVQYGKIAADLLDQARHADPENGEHVAIRAQWIAAIAMGAFARRCAETDGALEAVERAGLAVAKRLIERTP